MAKQEGRTINELSNALGWSNEKVERLCLKYEALGFYHRIKKKGKADVWVVTKKGMEELAEIRDKIEIFRGI